MELLALLWPPKVIPFAGKKKGKRKERDRERERNISEQCEND